ncbi:CDP-alcohol phosphatidyltransferase family protein [Marmoricola endophyticus]|uniref:CDP-alcohol phosphatidyltransferase family protein n=1 Tax=Marmoricola endophyticus TaxID=2040280 RepID=UPI001E63ECBB|nr:CDP-alcohol phosphatidyltransferase family protein [Marmoricola endophyticus]
MTLGASTAAPSAVPSPGRRLAAGSVHTYTAIGAVLALLMVHLSYRGEVSAVLWLFLAAIFIDGTDGFLARRLRVKEVMPGFDGALLDNIIDFMTYALAPMVLLWASGALPGGVWGGFWAALPVLASCYQFCQTDAKAVGEDHFFKGFPSYWNSVAFYAIAGSFSPTVTAVVIAVCTALVFVPVKYVYTTRTRKLFTVTMALAALWMVAYAVVVAQLSDPPLWLLYASLAYPVYYVVLSLWLTYLTSRRTHVAAPVAA